MPFVSSHADDEILGGLSHLFGEEVALTSHVAWHWNILVNSVNQHCFLNPQHGLNVDVSDTPTRRSESCPEQDIHLRAVHAFDLEIKHN
jgi:hypothetical protein